MSHVSTANVLAAGAGLSSHVDAVMAAEQVCEASLAQLRASSDEAGGGAAASAAAPDLALLFVSGSHVAKFAEVAAEVRRALWGGGGGAAGVLLGVSAQGVVGPDTELEDEAGVALLTLTLPGTRIHPFLYADLPFVGADDPESLARMAAALGAGPDLRGVIFFGDPFSVPVNPLVEAMSRCRTAVDGLKRVPVIGGMASAARVQGANVIAVNDRLLRAQGAGVSISGDVSIDTLVSQGCRPIGKPLVITEGGRNAIRKLGGRPAVEVLHELVHELPDRDRPLLNNGVFVGRVINEYKDRFGRGDFLIRGIVGVDRTSGALGVNDSVKVGQTVQFHLRDAATAREDLSLLLDAQRLQSPPAGTLLVTCNGRGSQFFGERHHDARAVSAALSPKPDEPTPMAGFFAAGEIGPVGDGSFVHGFSAAAAMFRAGRRK